MWPVTEHSMDCTVFDATGVSVRVPPVDDQASSDWTTPHGLVATVAAFASVVAAIFFVARIDFDDGSVREHQAFLNIERLRAGEPTRAGNRAVAAALPAIAYGGVSRPHLSARQPIQLAAIPHLSAERPLISKNRPASQRIRLAATSPRILPARLRLKSPLSELAHGQSSRRWSSKAVRASHRLTYANRLPRYLPLRYSAIPGAIAMSTAAPPVSGGHVRTPPLASVRLPAIDVPDVSLTTDVAAASPPRLPVLSVRHVASPPDSLLQGPPTGLLAGDEHAVARHDLKRLRAAPVVAAISLALHQAPDRTPLATPPPFASKLSDLAIQALPTTRRMTLTSPPRSPSDTLKPSLTGWLSAMLSPATPRLEGQHAYTRGRCIAPATLERIGRPVAAKPRRDDLKGDAFGLALAKAADRQRQWITIYSAKYQGLPYPLGDLPIMLGSCSDVIIRAYRDLGYDLQEEIQRARIGSGDKNIDHRRTNTLRRLFSRRGQSFTPSPYPESYRPGDIVTYYRPFSRVSRAHIAIVSHLIAPSGRPYIIHNRGYNVQLEDALFVDRMTGHYRFRPFDGTEPQLSIAANTPVASAQPASTSKASKAQRTSNRRMKPTYALGATR